MHHMGEFPLRHLFLKGYGITKIGVQYHDRVPTLGSEFGKVPARKPGGSSQKNFQIMISMGIEDLT